ncbi:MAG: hypothetical protein QOI06_3067 [Nocardioidaceae bacterium]|nr:hypothetical protein [Nocardioidaceae bacterium]
MRTLATAKLKRVRALELAADGRSFDRKLTDETYVPFTSRGTVEGDAGLRRSAKQFHGCARSSGPSEHGSNPSALRQ